MWTVYIKGSDKRNGKTNEKFSQLLFQYPLWKQTVHQWLFSPLERTRALPKVPNNGTFECHSSHRHFLWSFKYSRKWVRPGGTFTQQGYWLAVQIKRHPVSQSFFMKCWRGTVLLELCICLLPKILWLAPPPVAASLWLCLVPRVRIPKVPTSSKRMGTCGLSVSIHFFLNKRTMTPFTIYQLSQLPK